MLSASGAQVDRRVVEAGHERRKPISTSLAAGLNASAVRRVFNHERRELQQIHLPAIRRGDCERIPDVSHSFRARRCVDGRCSCPSRQFCLSRRLPYLEDRDQRLDTFASEQTAQPVFATYNPIFHSILVQELR